MPLRNATPLHFRPVGLQDGFDQSNTFPGACVSLRDLIFDQSNRNMLVSRPGVRLGVDFNVTGGWNAPGVISVLKVIGQRVYGMIASGRNPGKDEPFCFDIATGAFITISGVTAGNTPTTQPITGQWTPPTMTMVGTQIIITHPGFDGTGTNFFGNINVTTPATPSWLSRNVTGQPLVTVPTAVENFNNSAFYAVGNAVVGSDQLAPFVVTNAYQALIIGDTSPITALAPLPISTATEGVLAGLLAFKGAAETIWQITGAFGVGGGTIAIQQLAANIGCWAPRSIVPTPEGVKFMGVDAVYFVNLLGQILPVATDGAKNPDLHEPFLQASRAEASRSCASYNQGVYRICITSPVVGSVDRRDYWFDEHIRRWNGPHTFPYACAGSIGDKFVLCSNEYPARLFYSEAEQHDASEYTDQIDDTTFLPYDCIMLTGLMPSRYDMAMNAIVESEIELGRALGPSQYTITAQDEFGVFLGQTTASISTAGPLWGTAVYGSFVWSSGSAVSQIIPIPWTEPVVFKRMAIQIRTPANASSAIGTISMRYQRLGLMNMRSA